MENSKKDQSSQGDQAESLPSLIKAIGDHEVAGFDSTQDAKTFHHLNASTFGIEAAARGDDSVRYMPERTHSLSISMPSSPIENCMPNTKKVVFRDDVRTISHEIPNPTAMYENFGNPKKKAKFYSQPMPKGSVLNEAAMNGYNSNLPRSNPPNKLRDHRFDSFKTWSGRLERQISILRGKRREPEQNPPAQQHSEVDTLPVDRYFDALEGPELDTLRATETSALPDDKTWPFLLRFPVSSFGICLGVSSQAIMWKTLASVDSTKFLHVNIDVNLILWLISVALVVIISIIYGLKVIFYFEAVRREYYHPIRINFFFAPWIALLFLALGVPPAITKTLHASLWYVLMVPFLCLELKIYGQWMSGGQRRLSKVATPVNHLSVVGNFVGALLGASMGLKEGPIFFFAVGLAHYTVLFVTLYQRLPTNETLPKELHPVFFLFVAAPSVASMAWARIQGSFDYGSRIAYFIAMFLYFSLAVRVNFFRGIRFSLAWWAYTFPMTGAAIATIRYTEAVSNTVTKTLTVILCLVATLTVAALLVTTIIYAFVLRDLFPNDDAIAISDRRPKTTWRWYHRRSGSTDSNIEQYLKYACSDENDIEAGVSPPTQCNQASSVKGA
ncbi:S-type anion channel SLAH2-like isoform X2 [Andrographis paniculata]|nr:S-type anion channel SLAH2-like isoform X2 [Andrographis paniculata]XP_051123054.1 S-type anion channel SLAH2-like isoform X2 [Andrographis paniculata]XP_051123056.1 S-type anion channel SLAH2-like isoform X2 [Andrographis paniculata]XP_051123057.1 S-type anion channel SLAH2-like isoform X2 [Andrographis paniculata]